ncbi:Lmo2079 family surface lipoprotein [Paenilisteria rocourtiae]|uniref:Lipoprotein n=1 Tax=Listeria rocourtiae TaxID=647910 RepID=A0A4R6ZQ52_9LIST|nr:hypothetical protein [Listeria rocourtiae]EUJ42472.1 hypothetical protein PROCOU_17154 [Listeria rocourtiae FSL F6-920]MBC1435771.1 hypothetical protein [Listeria rocourtiae]MBC1604081.1 hypothetical protein [Listeria rocourtiae]TDR54595.1 hypothetical protein DFP96_102183 [Listeria rocourtiae]
MKKLTLLVLTLLIGFVLVACGSTPQEKFTKSVEKTSDPADQTTSTIGITIDELPATLKAQQSAAMLEGLSVKMTVANDQKAQKSAATIAVKTAGLVNIDATLDLLMDSKAEKIYLPLSDLYDDKGNLTTLLDQLTSGMFSQIKKENPDLATKYVELTGLADDLTNEKEQKEVTDTKAVEKATKDLSKKVTKIVSDYFSSLPEDRFKEGDNGEITVKLTKSDITKLANQLVKLADDKDVKADLKVIVTSQGVSENDFDEQYTATVKSIKDSIKDLESEKDAAITIDTTIKQGKDDAIENMKMKVKLTDTSDKENPEAMAFTITMKMTDSAKLPKFPSSSDVISAKELQKIIEEATAEYYKSMYGDALTDTDEIQ